MAREKGREVPAPPASLVRWTGIGKGIGAASQRARLGTTPCRHRSIGPEKGRSANDKSPGYSPEALSDMAGMRGFEAPPPCSRSKRTSPEP